MRVTIGKNKYMNLTAATYDEVFRHLIEDKRQDIRRALYIKSLDKHKGRLDDAKAEYISYLAHKYQNDQQTLIDKFNRPDFANIVVGSLVYHVSTLTHAFNKKYSFDQGKEWSSGRLFTAREIDDPEAFNFDIEQPEHEEESPDDEQYSNSALSISQFLQLIRLVLRSDEARDKFQKRDTDFYFKYFCVPYSQGNRVTIKQVALDKGVKYNALLARMKPIKAFIQTSIKPFIQ